MKGGLLAGAPSWSVIAQRTGTRLASTPSVDHAVLLVAKSPAKWNLRLKLDQRVDVARAYTNAVEIGAPKWPLETSFRGSCGIRRAKNLGMRRLRRD